VLRNIGQDIIAYPNPARKTVRFYWAQAGAVKIEINIYNPAGERVAKLSANNPTVPLDWEVRGLAPGVYFYQATLENNGSNRKTIFRKVAIINEAR